MKKEKLPTGFERRTPEWLKQEAEARGLKAGRKVRVETLGLNVEEYARKTYRRGKVTGLYPYIFVCEISGIAECFRYNQLIGSEVGERVKLDG